MPWTGRKYFDILIRGQELDVINTKSYSQVQGSVAIDVSHVRLNLQVTLEQVVHDVAVSKARTEVQRDMVLIVLSIHCQG